MRGDTADKQILIQKDKNATNNVLDSLTEKDLITKANTTLDLMGMTSMDKPWHMSFIGAKKLHNGSILYQMNTKEAVAWLWATDVQNVFMENYSSTSNMRNKLHYVIAKFVPVTYNVGSSYAHAKVENNNTLGSHTIMYLKYIKPPHLCTDNQRVAHMILSFTDWDDANTAIASGLFIEGKHMNICKSLTEPKRCLKCQKYGHYATECKATTDTCAQCGKPHCTTQGLITDTATFCCTNCIDVEAIGHGAVDRECPAFKTQHWKMQEWVRENKYKFFPTSLPTTWKLLNEPNSPIEDHQPRQWQDNHQHMDPTNWQHQQHFMEDWQTTWWQHGRPTPQDLTQDNG